MLATITLALPSLLFAQDAKDIVTAHVVAQAAAYEAMAMEIPVITSNICGIEELVDDGVNGILVPPKNPEAIADAIERILINPDLGRKMGEEGREKIGKDFNIKKEVNKLEMIFKRTANFI